MTPEQMNSFERFHADALAYCGVVDLHAIVGQGRFIRQVAIHLARLFASALQLSDIEPNTSQDLPDVFSPDQEAALTGALTETFGRYNIYREIFDPYHDPSEAAVHGSLADDLASIYDDLQNVIAARDNSKEDGFDDVLWSARFQFVHHWSEHATSALRALDALLNRQFIEELD